MRGLFSIVSLLIIAVAAAFYFTSGTPEVSNPGQYQKIEAQANAAAAQMAKDPQLEVDAASGDAKPAPPPATAPATNAPPAGH